MNDGGSTQQDIGKRLAMLRSWAGLESNMTAFAISSGLTASEYHAFETGTRRPSITAANKLRARWRVTLDWIYHGDRGGLSVEIERSLPRLAEWSAARAAS